MSQYFGAVNTTPTEGVTGHTVKLIPANLCGHEEWDVATTHNLWQSSTVTKYIR